VPADHRIEPSPDNAEHDPADEGCPELFDHIENEGALIPPGTVNDSEIWYPASL